MAFPDSYPTEYWPTSSHDVESLEFDWFAQDRNGQLAAFTSAGRGFIPQRVFARSEVPYNDMIAAIARRAASPAIFAFTGKGRYHDWQVFAEHGLFAYDFQDVHRIRVDERGGYDLLYRPSVRATIADLLEQVVRYLPLIETEFGASDFVPLSLIRDLDVNNAL